jgi:hypothetical protein
VHPSVEQFVQNSGLQYCVEGEGFPPQCQISARVYDPLAYPGPDAVQFYDATTWD